jgi:hypothetical protein
MLHHFQSSPFGGCGDIRFDSFRHPIVHNSSDMDTSSGINVTDDAKLKLAQKSGSFESTLPTSSSSSIIAPATTVNNNHMSCNINKLEHKKKNKHYPTSYCVQIPIAASTASSSHSHSQSHHHKHKQSRRRLKLQLQFDDHSFMDCSNLNDFLSSSSLSSSDSETEETNESDHEGDDELTDWPGHEAMINFASKNEFKRANNIASKQKAFGNKLPLIKQHDDIIIQDDDTLMSADEIQTAETPSIFPLSSSGGQSHPINIIGAIESSMMQGSSSTSGVVADGGYGSSFNATSSYSCKQPIESEMSGE